MAYIGNFRGPKKSVIVAKLGPDYFGITSEQLNEEIYFYKVDEENMEVDSVHVDENGKPYVIFRAPLGKFQRFYLHEHGYILTGTIKTYNGT